MRTTPSSFRFGVKWTALLACWALAACTANAISPPGRTTPLESAAAIGQGAVGVQGEAGISGAVFGPSLGHATARVRVGVLERTDVSGEANVVVVRELEPTGTHRGIYSLRGGVKHAFTPNFAVVGGLGFGASAGGGFISPDIGFIAGIGNAYVVPFLSARLIISQPIAPQQVTLPQDVGDADLEYITDTPEFTYGFAANMGLRFPFQQPNRAVQHDLQARCLLQSPRMHCRFCRSAMAYIHGHAACITGGCPMYGVNQAECCDGETVSNCPAPTSDVAAGPAGAYDAALTTPANGGTKAEQ